MKRIYLISVALFTVAIVLVQVLVHADPAAHGSWQIRLENYAWAPGAIVLFPLLFLTGGEPSVFATVVLFAAYVVSAAVYSLPVLGIAWLIRGRDR